MAYRACYSTWFSAAQRIRGHPVWGRIHGHTFRIRVCVSGEKLGAYNMLIDYADLKRMVDSIVSLLDHREANSVLGLEDASSEAIAEWIYEKLGEEARRRGLSLDMVELCPQPDFCVEYRGGGSSSENS